MSDASAQVLVIGAGIVGTSLAYHLALRGCTDVLVVDQGPLPATGGSSSHAPGLVFQTNASQALTQLAASTVEQLRPDGRAGDELAGEVDAPCFYPVGGIEVATTEARWNDLHRKQGLATAWGIPGAQLLSPAEVAARIPQLDAARIHGGLHVASDGIAKPVRAVAAMARRARRLGVRFHGYTEVTRFDTVGGRIRSVRTSRGVVTVETVLCCAGIWGPRVGRLAGVSVPVQPLAHQYVVTTTTTTTVGGFVHPATEVAEPILRHQDRSLYLRQIHGRYGIGSYQHRPMPVDADNLSVTSAPGDGLEAPSAGGGWAGMASVHPFTPDDFKQAWADASDLLPALHHAEVAEGMNGLFLFTADGMPVLGPSVEVPNFWTAEAVWITHGPGVGKAMAEWLVDGRPVTDLRAADGRRFDRFAHSPAYVSVRAQQSFREVYDVLHPQQPPEQPRPLRTSPFYPRQQQLGAVFLEANGWERPHWYEANASLADGRELPVPGEWAGRYVPAVVGAEHQITRERVACYDMTPLSRAEVTGPGALGLLQRLTTGELDRPPGYVTYTLLLDATGRIRSDITVARLAADRFQVGHNGPRDLAWLRAHADDRVGIRDATGGSCCIGLWGPRARDVLAPLASADVSHEAFRPFRAAEFMVGEVPVTALRLSYVGELGWELYTSAEFGLRLWDLLLRAGADHGVIAAGRGAFTGLRIEKGYRAWGTDMWSDHDPDEAGLSFAVKPCKGDFLGRVALLRRRERPPARRLRCLTIDDGTVVLGAEPVFDPTDARRAAIGFVTSAAYGYTVGRSLALAWLPRELSEQGTPVEIGYFGRRHRATVTPDPAFDPSMLRMRC